ncbi:MAG: FGGY-family carbohydrate kinase [Lachnospiraceae bacterium]|nr:FGGY-family carbohydrate kinase [Lachnospiraceae bacterium]
MKRNQTKIKQAIAAGQAILGIELGSTRIKAVLITPDHILAAQGSYTWENCLTNGIWTYSLKDIWIGLQAAYADLARDVEEKYGEKLTTLAAIGISAMMHGYLVFDENDELLVPFRTWRNTMTEKAADALTDLFQFNIPQRWSVAHLYQAILNGEDHVSRICYQTTLAGYVHWKLTGQKVLGAGDASGMFPVDPATGQFDVLKMEAFDSLIVNTVRLDTDDRKKTAADRRCADDSAAAADNQTIPWILADIFPRVLKAGESAGVLTEEGARLLDPTGCLRAGIPFCPPEGDAGTGMVATNSVRQRTGNVSAGTSVFAMVVLERNLSEVYRELDLVTTPTGDPVAMVHCNNCTSDLNAWIDLFRQFGELFGMETDDDRLYTALYRKALEGDADGGGILVCNYLSGESITGFDEGRPLLMRHPDSTLDLANFMRANLYSAVATLKIGLDILLKQENVPVDFMMGHGGLFKTKEVGAKIMAAAMNTPVAVMETAGEGGAWGIALLASYMLNGGGMTLGDYLEQRVFVHSECYVTEPDPEDVRGFEAYMERYIKGLSVERAAVEEDRGADR